VINHQFQKVLMAELLLVGSCQLHQVMLLLRCWYLDWWIAASAFFKLCAIHRHKICGTFCTYAI